MSRVVHLPSGKKGTVLTTGDLARVDWDSGYTSSVDADDLRPVDDCASCADTPDQRCRSSRRSCGHHCDHSWTHDQCCWCGATWGEAIAETGNRTPTPRPPDEIKAMSTSVGIPETGRKAGE